MGLIIPTVSSEPGPTYAVDINASLSSIDSHNHTFGQGVAIPTSGLNINADLSFTGNNAVNLRSTRYTSQNSVLSLSNDLGCIYLVGVDLYCNDGNGNNIRITQSGGLAGTSGSIANLVPPASAQYVAVSQKFVWQSASNVAATMDFRSAILRNASASSFGLTLQPPASMPSDYTITLPFAPGSTSFLGIDSGGNITSVASVSQGIAASNIINNTITFNQIAPGNLTLGVINSVSAFPAVKYQEFNSVASSSFVIPNNVTQLFVQLVGGGGGGGAGLQNGAGGGGAGGGGGVNPIFTICTCSGGETLVVSVGNAGGGGATSGAAGTDGGTSKLLRSGGILVQCGGGAHGEGGGLPGGGAGGAAGYNPAGLLTGGGAGGAGNTTADGSAGGAGMAGNGGSGGTGGGGAAGGGGGGGPGLGAGGNGGQFGSINGGTPSTFGAGGGGGAGGTSDFGRGGNGGTGYVRLSWVTWG